MQLIIDLPEREETLTLVRTGWERAAADPYWQSMAGRFESNAFGEIIMSPPPPFAHSDRSFRMAKRIEQFLGGHALTECPILTIDGVKLADAAWFSGDRYQQIRQQSAVEIAPEICVEVRSPSNTDAEMRHKRQLSFNQDARECWTRELNGQVDFFVAGDFRTPVPTSPLCPDFPTEFN